MNKATRDGAVKLLEVQQETRVRYLARQIDTTSDPYAIIEAARELSGILEEHERIKKLLFTFDAPGLHNFDLGG